MSWSIPIDRLAQKYKARLEVVAKKATFEVFRSVVLKSPVDTGRFRANWNVSYGTPNMTTSTSVDQGRATIEVNKSLSLPVGGIVYLSNGLPYGRKLEYGYSKQAPAGMIRTSVIEFNRHVQAALR